MSAPIAEPAAAQEDVLPTSPFLDQLVQVVRADDTWGTWEGVSDIDLLADYVVTAEARRAIPISGDPEPELVWRVEQFYAAVGLLLARRTGCRVEPLSRIHWEGFGRVVLIAGRLVVLTRHLRDIHRFGFPSFAALASAGESLTEEAASMLRAHPDLARAG